ncbi:hypothetical protein [Sinorhizobium medicae]|uniref:hypothetical protein n=1 Tax=Sinorhizobium medicae TaxID=110321 RepID=UPI00138FCEC8|nr:hypothetical protein [Sinorhizobium medicae]
MTKNIIGLPIVGSLCYKSVGLVKSIVWMSAIREMDAVRIVDGRSVHQAQRHISAVGHNKTAGDAMSPLRLGVFIFTGWIPLIKTINFTNLGDCD